MNTTPTNRLIHETSLYLQQHAHNPVDWYPWGEEALQRAQLEHKPIFLSIGYSACHWCHVMAHESFEDDAVAQVLNARFINIKLDREERPDLDKIYQTAYQLLNGRAGGWPLNVILTPDDQAPFFAITYVPKEPRHGMPGFVDLMQRVADFFGQREDAVRQQNTELVKALKTGPPRQGQTGYSLHAGPLEGVITQLTQSFDTDHGGFGGAPKFPQPQAIERLLRHWWHSEQQGNPDKPAAQMAKFSLEKMAQGGVYDQLGGGFFRYSVDARWQIPHFEKMLYDNGQLLSLYSQAWRATGVTAFQTVIETTINWAEREMRSPEGGFYSALDADSEGEEGRFYVWTRKQVQAVLEEPEYALLAAVSGLNKGANFEGHAWHLTQQQSLEQATRKLKLEAQQARELLQQAQQKLLTARAQRVRPARDEKILTAWNALMIKGLASAGRYLEQPEYIQAAERTLDFIKDRLWQNGRLLATYQQGQARFPAYLDDYALLIDAILELLQCRWRDGDLNWALELAQVLLEHFQDHSKQGGFYFTTDDHEPLVARLKPVHDESLPAGNGVTAYNMIRLGHLTNSLPYLLAAERALKNAWPAIERQPIACCSMLLALEEYYFPTQTVVIRGPADQLEAWRKACAHDFAPRRLTLAIPNDASDLPPFLALRQGRDDGVVAYLCSGSQCSAPITELDALVTALQAEPEAPGTSQ